MNATQQLVAVGKGSDNSLVNLFGKVTWRVSSGSGVASVSATGLLKRLTAGNAEIEATALGKVTTLKLTSNVQDLVLGYDNSVSKWTKVYVHLFTGSTGITTWPGVEMTNNNGIWTYTVEAAKLVNGKISVVFNSGLNGSQTKDQPDIAESSTFKEGVWTPSGGATTSAQVSVIAGIIQGGGSVFPAGSVVTINANAPTDNFTDWTGASAAYIFTDPSKPSAQMVVPSGVTSMSVQAEFAITSDPYQTARSLYAAQCSRCHGINGANGVDGGLNGLHISEDYTLAQLVTKISTTMPKGAKADALCSGTTPGTCGYDIAKMILDNKWLAADTCTTASCNAGDSLDRRNLRLLTSEEYLNSARDIFGVNITDAVMANATGDGAVRNFNTAASLALDYDRTVGYQMAAAEISKQVIAAKTFFSLGANCSNAQCTVTSLGKKVFRRPLTSIEVTRYVDLYTAADAGKAVIQAMLISPNFMYRSEMGTLDTATNLYKLNSYEIATLLSYSLWASAPDDALLTAAAGTLDIRAQVTRMLNDAKADRGLRRFAQGWLLNSKYGYLAISDAALASSFDEETIKFAMETIKADLPYKELLTANYTYANPVLASYYGNTAVASWTKSVFGDSNPRSGTGILGHGSFLATRVSSNENPSPIKRGTFVRDVLMCQELPPPQKAGLSIPKGPTDTNRTANAKHTNDAACQGCHQYIDGVGFGFENYGSNGLFRVQELTGNGTPVDIDASGSVKSLYSAEATLDPKSEAVAYQSVPQLANLLANSGQGAACYSRQFYRYVTGRSEEAADAKIIPAYSANMRAGGGMKEMIIDLTLNPSFIMRR